MFVEFFIRRPIFAAVCSIILTLVGLLAIPSLPIAQYPDLAPPQVTVTSTYVGASSDIVESAVTIPLEQELNGVEGMRYMTSTSGNDGVSVITITFEPSRDIEVAAVDVQNRVSRASARLPGQVNQTGIVVTKASTQLLMSMGLFSPDGRYDSKFLSNYADVNLKDALKRIRGVGEVRIFGERKFSMRVWLDPTELARRKITAQEVIRALQEQNLQVAAGQVGQPPSNPDQAYQIAVRARGRLIEPEEFSEIVVQRSEAGQIVRIRDVARVELGAENYGQILRFGGRTAVGVGIFQLPTANALDVRDAVLREMDRQAKQFPPGMEYKPATDTTLAVRASIDEVITTLAEAIALVILVIFVFLHGWRSVLITALTLPVSLLGTFAFVKLFGFSINTLTLFGLTLATGLVVDDAIVVIENVERLMVEKKLSALQAAREGMREVSGAVVAISIVLVAVFVPVAFFPGTTGAIYRQFALTIAAAVALSTFCALTLTPALSALLLQEREGQKWILFRKVDQMLDFLRAVYARVLGRLLRRPLLVLLAFLACLGGTVLLFRAVPTGFIPDEDQGYVIVGVQAPEGTSLAETERVLMQVETILKQQPEVRGMFAIGGFSQLGNGPNMGQVFSMLRPWEDRVGKEHSVQALVERLRPALGRIGQARVVPFQPPAIRGVGTVGGFQFVVEDQSGSRTLDELSQAVDGLVAKAAEQPRLRGVFSTFTAATPLLDVEVDRQKAKSLGVPIDQIFSTLQLYMGSQYVNDFNYASRTYRVYLQADKQFRDSPQDISAFYVKNDAGAMLPLDGLVRVTPTTSSQVIRHYNLFRSAEINGQAAPGVSSGEALAAMEALAAEGLPEGMGSEWTGVSLEQKESGGQTLIIFGLGLLFVFLVLAAQYESFVLPFVVIFSVPLAILGALGLQVARGFPNDVFCQVGLVMLIGLASKNAILIVEFAEHLRAQGKSAVEAVIGGAGVRLRPILMTSIAFLLGVVPLMLAGGAGAAARNSLGTTVFGGERGSPRPQRVQGTPRPEPDSGTASREPAWFLTARDGHSTVADDPPMQGATVATTSSRALLAACRKLGVDTAALLADAGLTASELENPEGRLRGEAVAILFRQALVRSGDPDLPLRAAAAVPFGAYKVIDFLAASAPTVGEGLVRVARYFPLINSTAELRIHDDGEVLRLELGNPLDPAGLPKPYAEYALAVTLLHCRHAAGFDWPILEACFAFPQPASSAMHQSVFASKVTFGAARNELVIARSVWDSPSRGASSSELLAVLEAHAERTISSLRGNEPVQSSVTRLLTEALRGGEPSLESVAKQLHLSPRTLQRKLQAEGASFADVLDRTRRSTADVYLRRRELALTEIAYLLGFSEQSAFTRAFQRWYGVPPSRYREQAGAA